ncbi:GNAT family N-acetyltransferase [Amycolatopsis pigmentata]|uniref:GNAT family N-acetyltransferase n=1 Tax=Amycolatopsis pigmentata TaxID=450801 RepID=A0ABW5FVC3_9PSEU
MTIASPSVRTARVTDAEAIGRIHVVAWQATYAGVLPAEFLRNLSVADRQRAWRERLAQDDPRRHVLVVTADSDVVGFACAGVCRDDDAPPRTGELWSIYLIPAHWGHGHGRRLHDETLAALERDSYRRATLWVLDSNARARRFYENRGWSPDGATKAEPIGGSAPLTEIRYATRLTASR